MPRSRPDAETLLDAAVGYLEGELLPTLSGHHRFQLRVTVNVLRQVARELRLAGPQEEAERARLRALLARAGEAPDADTDTAALSRALAARIRAGEIALDDPALLAHLRASLEEALRINNPKWLQR